MKEAQQLREMIRSGAVMPGNPLYSQFVARVYELERQAEQANQP